MIERPRLLLLDEADDVLVATQPIRRGETVPIDGRPATVDADIGLGHKVARHRIEALSQVKKYGVSIGVACRTIEPGQHVHVHNLKSGYTPTYTLDADERNGAGR